MRKKKLYQLLLLLTKDDQEQFSLFLGSPYFNSSEILIQFWDQWKEKMLGEAEETEISEEEFVEGSPIRVSRLDALSWELMVKVRKFMSLRGFEESPEMETLMFSRAFLERDSGLNAFPRFIPQAIKQLESQPDSADKYLVTTLLQSEVNRARVFARKMDSEWQAEFAEMDKSLERFVELKRLQWNCGALNARSVFRQKGEIQDFDLLGIDVSVREGEVASLLARIYRLVFLMLRGGKGNVIIPQILEILDQRREDLVEDVRHEVVTYVLNYCIQQINVGNEEYLGHTFELYRMMLKFGDLLTNGQISPQQFKNNVSLACRLNKLDWVAEFIETYHPLLRDDHGGFALEYNMAVLKFHQKEYPEAIRLLQMVMQENTYDIFYGLDARIYLWKSYYENLAHLTAAELDDMYRLYDSFRLYVSRNEKISPLHQKQYRNFVRLFKRFMVCMEEAEPRAGLLELQKELDTVEGVANKSWFLQKIIHALEQS